MKRIIILVFCPLLIISGGVYFTMAQSHSNLTSKDNLQIEDLKIMDIYLGQPISEALSKLDNPIGIKKGSPGNDLDKYYYFSGIMIATSKYYQGKIGYISLTKKDIVTNRGIKIGDSEKNVIEKYGKPIRAKNILIYEMKYDPFYNCAIDFIINHGHVEKIVIAYVTTD